MECGTGHWRWVTVSGDSTKACYCDSVTIKLSMVFSAASCSLEAECAVGHAGECGTE